MKIIFFQLLMVVAYAALAESIPGNDFVYGVNEFSGYMAEHLKVFSKDSHPQSPESRKLVQNYIRERFETIGFKVEEQNFNSTVLMEFNGPQQVQGTNIIGIREGSSPKNLVVVGAHYDSTGVTENHYPERNNGVGIATLIEVARAYENSIRDRGYVANYTTIFVAFDLNTKEQKPTSPGIPGSEYFVEKWLIPKIDRERLTYLGSFILDSIATYNTEENSQTLPSDFNVIFPEAYQTINSTEKKGNFLAAVSSGGGSKKLLEDFEGHYNFAKLLQQHTTFYKMDVVGSTALYRDRRARRFRLQPLVGNLTSTGLGHLGTVDMFDDQASVYFWTSSMPSVLLTDTAGYRTLPPGEKHEIDPHYVFWNPERQAFVQKTYQALCYTILDSQTTYVGLKETSTASSTTATLLATAAFVVMARLLA